MAIGRYRGSDYYQHKRRPRLGNRPSGIRAYFVAGDDWHGGMLSLSSSKQHSAVPAGDKGEHASKAILMGREL